MKHYLNLVCGLGLVLGASLASAQSCFSTKAQYDQIKDQLPRSMQILPAVFTVEEGLGSGGFAVTQSGDGFRVRMKKIVLGMPTPEVDQRVKSVCLAANQIMVRLENGSSHLLRVQGNNVVFEQHTLARTDMATYNRLLNPPSRFGGAQSMTSSQ